MWYEVECDLDKVIVYKERKIFAKKSLAQAIYTIFAECESRIIVPIYAITS